MTTPDLFVRISQPLANRLVAQPWYEQKPIAQYALGAYIQGNSTTRAQSTLVLVPNSNLAEFAVDLMGETDALTSASQSRATVYARSATPFHARKYLWLDPVKGILEVPSTTNTKIWSEICGLDVDAHFPFRWLVDRIAWKRVYEAKPAADQLTAQQVAAQVNQELDQKVNAQIASFKKELEGNFMISSPAQLGFENTKTASTLQALFLESFLSKTSHSFIPETFATSPELGVMATENGLVTPLQNFLSGTTVDLSQWQPKSAETAAPILTFSGQAPIEIGLDANVVALTLRMDSVSVGTKRYPARKIQVRYGVGVLRNNLRLIRQGDILVLPPGKNSEEGMSADDQQIQEEIRNDLALFLPAGFTVTPFKLPGPLANLGTFHFTEVSAQAGVLTVGISMESVVKAALLNSR